MGRERERKVAIAMLSQQQQQQQQHQQQQQQQWQAKGGFTGPAYAPVVLGRFNTDSSLDVASNSSSSMKDPLSRTKAVIRRLPPTLTHHAFLAQIDAKFANTYSWLAFRPGKSSPRSQVHSRAYIDFNRPLDLLTFHHDFDGHVFVNEKGAQFKASVEYAPCQRVPDPLMKKDGREGTLLKDPDYVEFVESLSKPVELLPSAEVQLERRESERAGSSKEGLIVTPLMEFVRQKRAAKHAQRAAKAGFRSLMGAAPSFGYAIQKRGEKGKSGSEGSKDGGPVSARRSRRRDSAEKKFNRDREVPAAADEIASHKEADEVSAGVDTDAVEVQRKDQTGRKFVKDKEVVSPGYTTSRGRPPPSPAQISFKQSYRDRSSRVGSPKDTEAGRASKDANANGTGPDGRRLRNKDRPDRPVWTPRRRLDTVDPEGDSAEGIQTPAIRTRGSRAARTGAQDVNEPENELDRNGAFENGTYRTGNRKGFKDLDVVPEAGKHLKRGAAPFGNNEKQVWVAVQKTG